MSANALLHKSFRAEMKLCEVGESINVMRWVTRGMYGRWIGVNM